MKEFAERLYDLRMETGISQGKLAKAIGVTQPTIARYEADFQSPTAEVIVELAKFFGVTADYLLGLRDD